MTVKKLGSSTSECLKTDLLLTSLDRVDPMNSSANTKVTGEISSKGSKTGDALVNKDDTNRQHFWLTEDLVKIA